MTIPLEVLTNLTSTPHSKLTPSQLLEREKLANTPGLTKAQAAAVRDPNYSMAIVRAIIKATQAQAALIHSAKPEEQRDLERKMGMTREVSDSSVHYSGGNVVQHFGGRTLEIPRGR